MENSGNASYCVFLFYYYIVYQVTSACWNIIYGRYAENRETHSYWLISVEYNCT